MCSIKNCLGISTVYHWLRAYILEQLDVCNRTVHERNVGLAKQRMHKNTSGPSTGSIGLADGDGRVLYHTERKSTSDNHQDPQGTLSVGSHHGRNSHEKEHERFTPTEGSTLARPAQMLQKISSAADQCSARHNSALVPAASATSVYDAAKDIMDALRSKHSNLAAELEILLSDIGSRFVTLPEERLLADVYTLLHTVTSTLATTTAEVPLFLKKELSNVCRVFFSADLVNKHVHFVREYKQDFEQDFDPESTTTFPATLSKLNERLKHWKDVLQSNVEDRFPDVLKLEEERWQYSIDQDVAPDHTVKLDRIAADIPIVRRHGSSFRRLTLIGSDGSRQHFLVQTSLADNARSDENMLQLFRVMNRMFDKHKDSRRRQLCLHAPIIIPLWSQVQMVEDDLTYSSFLEVYELNCAQHNWESDLPITRFKEQLNHAISGQVSPEAVSDLRLQAYNDITKTLVCDNIFSQYMYKTMLSGNHLWVFKKQFSVQLAVSNFMSVMLQIGGRSPNKTLFSKSTGKLFQSDFHPAFDANGMVESSEPVPFRLTRNMQAFFSHFGVEGLIVSAMCAAEQALVSTKQCEHMWYHLAMFFRDELFYWSWRRPSGLSTFPNGVGCNIHGHLDMYPTWIIFKIWRVHVT